ncbi:nitrile hydratase [Shimia gijangensis]|uniref:Nitrile hydratase subunit beta n=1 Tax=Shimia gijangensis TaxID=1470563 RepID=A0A1M6E0C0_9RHOB|nr:nitrile hydratase subunit beta [Shimia gijangensis]SHI78718.1 nitrile hydratase [Shimia gijangensis]
MSRVHDMGGRYGDGAVDPSDSATFAQDWHARAMALTLAAGALGQWNIDVSRHAREALSPKDYSRFTYYEKWLAAMADMLVHQGVVTPEELSTGHATGVSDLASRALKADAVAGVLAKGSPYQRTDAEPAAFRPGDTVRTRRPARNVMVTGGHTRLPSYAAGMPGQVVLRHGAHVLPDANAHGQGESPEPLYAVAFSARDLWGDEASVQDEVILDLWQSYLEPA